MFSAISVEYSTDNRVMGSGLGSKMRPFGRVVATCALMVEVEVVVDRSMDGGELLEGLHVTEFRHRPLSSDSISA
jgi:hypothetical protein